MARPRKNHITIDEEIIKQEEQVSIAALEEIPDGCAETFPFELIEDLRREYFPD